MKRYKLTSISMDEHSEGIWCKYSDVVGLVAEIEKLKESVKNRNESLKGIASMNPETEGNRMKQWARDSLSGFVENYDSTVKRQQDEINVLKLQLSGRTYCHSDEAVEKELKELTEHCEALTDCLNGSSKAVYTAEMYDKAHDAGRSGGLEQSARVAEGSYLVVSQTPSVEWCKGFNSACKDISIALRKAAQEVAT